MGGGKAREGSATSEGYSTDIEAGLSDDDLKQRRKGRMNHLSTELSQV